MPAPSTPPPPEVIARVRARAAAAARDSLIAFVRFMRPDLHIPRHWVLIAHALERMERGELLRLIITIPVRHGKTELAHKLFPAWFLGRNPTRQLMSATHKSDLARDCGRDIKRYVDMPEFREIFPGVTLAPDSHASGKFHVRAEGQLREGVLTTVGRGGEAAGRGADILIPDDLLGEREAYSEADKEEARVMLRSLRGRLEPKGAILIIQSRVAEDDPVAYALEQYPLDKWERICLPAIAESREAHRMPDGSTWVREPGTALWPERYPLEELENIRDQSPAHEWSARYQQHPVPIGKRIVEEIWFAERRYNDDPRDLALSALRIVVSIDTSEGTKDGAETAIETYAEHPQGSYLIEVESERWQTPEILDRIRAVCKRYRPTVCLIERKSTGTSVIQQLRADPGFSTAIEGITPPTNMDKIARFAVETPAMKNGFLWLPRKGHPRCVAWQAKFERELFLFPACPQKDQSDALSQYLAYKRRNPTPMSKTGSGAWTQLMGSHLPQPDPFAELGIF